MCTSALPSYVVASIISPKYSTFRRCSSRCRPAVRSYVWPRACSAPFTRHASRRSSSADRSHRRVSASLRIALELGFTFTKWRTATYYEPASRNIWFYKAHWTSSRVPCLSRSSWSYGSRDTKVSIPAFDSTPTVPVCRPTRSLTLPTHPIWPATLHVVRWPYVSCPWEGQTHRPPEWSTLSNCKSSMTSTMCSKKTKACFSMFNGGGIMCGGVSGGIQQHVLISWKPCVVVLGTLEPILSFTLLIQNKYIDH